MSLYKNYSLLAIFRLAKDVCLTKMTTPQARLIRRPFYCRGMPFIQFGKGFTPGVGLRLDALPQVGMKTPLLRFGVNCQVNDYVHIGCIDSIDIGDDVLIASKVFITDHNHGDLGSINDFMLAPTKRELTSKKIVIQDKVWIGESVMILPGVTIGEGCVIGAASVVTKDIQSYSVAVGSPAKVIKTYDFTQKCWVKIK